MARARGHFSRPDHKHKSNRWNFLLQCSFSVELNLKKTFFRFNLAFYLSALLMCVYVLVNVCLWFCYQINLIECCVCCCCCFCWKQLFTYLFLFFWIFFIIFSYCCWWWCCRSMNIICMYILQIIFILFLYVLCLNQ